MTMEDDPRVYNLYHGLKPSKIWKRIKDGGQTFLAKKRDRNTFDNCYTAFLTTMFSLLFMLAGLAIWMGIGPHDKVKDTGLEAMDLVMVPLAGAGTIAAINQRLYNQRNLDKDIKFKQSCLFIRKAISEFTFGVISCVFGSLSISDSKHCTENKENKETDCQFEMKAFVYAAISYLIGGYLLYSSVKNIQNRNVHSAEWKKGVLYVEKKDTISMSEVFEELSHRLGKKKRENVAIAILNLDDGDRFEVQQYRCGRINYIVTSGSISIMAEFLLDGSTTNAKVRISANGNIEFTNSRYNDLLRQGKVNVEDKKKYIGGKELLTALKEGNWKSLETDQSPSTILNRPLLGTPIDRSSMEV